MNSIFTPDRLVTVLGLVVSVVSLIAFRKMSQKLLGALILTLAILFGAQTWFLLQFERSVDHARNAVLKYMGKETRTESMISKHLTRSFDPDVIHEALKGLHSEGTIKKKTIEAVYRGPHGHVTFEFPVYCNSKAQEGAGLKPFCD